MDVSIIIINYNTLELTCNCIESIVKYTTDISYEIIVIDNASNNADFSPLEQKGYPLTVIKNKDNTGFAKACNQGILAAKGDTVLLLNSDVELIENTIKLCKEKLYTALAGDAVITCKLTYPDGTVQKQCSRFPHITNNLLELFRIHKLLSMQQRAKIFSGSYFDHQSDCYPDWIWGTFFMFNKSLLKLLPGNKLNEDYFMYCEDMRWCYDFKKAGKKAYYYAETRVIHHVGQSSLNSGFKIRSIIYNELDFIAKTKGKLYMLLFGIIRGLNVLFASFLNKTNYQSGVTYFQMAFRKLFNFPAK